MQLGPRFSHLSNSLQSDGPLTDEQIRTVAPSTFSEDKHGSRSESYSYIPTISVLTELRKEGFEPFMVCQTRVRNEDSRDLTTHMQCLRHASDLQAREANEISLINSYDGTSSYQMMAGQFRFVCRGGLVCGNTVADIRFPHTGDITGVVQGAFDVLDGFDSCTKSKMACRTWCAVACAA